MYPSIAARKLGPMIYTQLAQCLPPDLNSLLSLACVADALNLLYIAYKGFRRVRGPAATQAICLKICKRPMIITAVFTNGILPLTAMYHSLFCDM